MDGGLSGALERAARGRRTQSLFRDLNERVFAINDGFRELVPIGDWVCECAEKTYVERIALTPVEYEAVRAHPTHFAVAPGAQHVLDQIETVVKQTDRYWVVEQYSASGELLTKLDPRRVAV